MLPVELRQRWLELVRPALHFYGRGDGDGDGDGPTVWWYGGEPDLPDDVPWPVLEGMGPLNYVATLDCSGVPRHGLDIPLPEDGRLVFFIHEDLGETARDRATVIHVPASTATRPRRCPEETLGSVFAHETEQFLVVKGVVPTIPDTGTVMVTALGIPGECGEDLAHCLDDLEQELPWWQSQVGGHPHWAQYPILLDSEGNLCGPSDLRDPAYMRLALGRGYAWGGGARRIGQSS
ncbi:DUF1963 domain-containing protein [Streptomyces scopuliridis]|uniref:DUF1963 domain-containing protein n=1 Tax=Streptomyces scopuliridis TaxID=452529 RepID=UPI0036AB43E1